MFVMLLRVFFDTTKHHSVEYFMLDDYDSMDALLDAARVRFHRVIATDLDNQAVVCMLTELLDPNGVPLEKFSRDRRVAPTPEE